MKISKELNRIACRNPKLRHQIERALHVNMQYSYDVVDVEPEPEPEIPFSVCDIVGAAYLGTQAGVFADSTTYLGMRIQIGAVPLKLTHLGRWRWYAVGYVHQMIVIDFETGITVATATVNLGSGGDGTFVYAPINEANVILQANKVYRVFSLEYNGTPWAWQAAMNSNDDFDITWGDAIGGAQYNSSQSYGPVNFIYCKQP